MIGQDVKDEILVIEGMIEELCDEYCMLDIPPVMNKIQELLDSVDSGNS